MYMNAEGFTTAINVGGRMPCYNRVLIKALFVSLSLEE